MKKLLGILMLPLCLHTYAADWVKLGEKADSDLYYDASTAAKEGRQPEVWVLVDYKNPQPFDDKSYMSTKRLLLVSCPEKKYAYQKLFFYSKGMGEGEVINSTIFEKAELADIPAESGIERIYMQACRQ